MKKSELKLFLKKIVTEARLLETSIQDPTKDEMFNFLRGMYGNEEGFRDDAEVAMYWFANFFHGGQGSNLYSVLSTSRFHPGHSARGPQPDSMEQMMYDDLVMQFAPDSEEAQEIQRERNSLNEAYEHESAIKKQIYGALEKAGFQKKGSTPRDYMEYYLNGFATVSCVVNVAERTVFFDRYYDSERVDSLPGNHIEKTIPLTEDPHKNEELAQKVIAIVLKLKKSIDGDESIFGGIDDINEGDEADAVNDMWAGSDDDLSSYEVPPTTKQTSKQFFRGNKKKQAKTVQDIDWDRIKRGIDKHTLSEEDKKEDPKDAMYVEYVGPWGNEKPFILKTANGKEKFEYCKGKYPDGTEDIAVYAYRGDMCWGYKAWQKQYTSLQENSVGGEYRVDYGVRGLEAIEPTYHKTSAEAWTAAKNFIAGYATPKALKAGYFVKKFDDGYALRHVGGSADAVAFVRNQ